MTRPVTNNHKWMVTIADSDYVRCCHRRMWRATAAASLPSFYPRPCLVRPATVTAPHALALRDTPLPRGTLLDSGVAERVAEGATSTDHQPI